MNLVFEDSEMFVDDPDGPGKLEVPVKMWCAPRSETKAHMVNVFAIQENETWTVYKYNAELDRDFSVHVGLSLDTAKALIAILGADT